MWKLAKAKITLILSIVKFHYYHANQSNEYLFFSVTVKYGAYDSGEP